VSATSSENTPTILALLMFPRLRFSPPIVLCLQRVNRHWAASLAKGPGGSGRLLAKLLAVRICHSEYVYVNEEFPSQLPAWLTCRGGDTF
jgi:hypothetical protein